MNWELVKWFAGICLTLGGIRIVWTMFRSIFSKDSIHGVMDAAGNRIDEAGGRLTDTLKKKAEERKQKKERENRPIITYRY